MDGRRGHRRVLQDRPRSSSAGLGNLTGTAPDNITAYWLTGTGASAARSYWEAYGPARRPRASGSSAADDPVRLATFPGTSAHAAQLGQASYWNVPISDEVDRGGHFAAWEEPELFASRNSGVVRSLRCSRVGVGCRRSRAIWSLPPRPMSRRGPPADSGRRPLSPYCRAIATRSRSSGVIRWSGSSASSPRSICDPADAAVERELGRAEVVADRACRCREPTSSGLVAGEEHRHGRVDASLADLRAVEVEARRPALAEAAAVVGELHPDLMLARPGSRRRRGP